MWGTLSKAFREVKQNRDVPWLLKRRSFVLYCWQQLGFARAFLPEPVLSHKTVLVKMMHNIAVNSMFVQVVRDGGERNGSVIWLFS